MPKHDGSWTAMKFVGIVLLALLVAGGAFVWIQYGAPYFKREALEKAYEGKLQELFDEAKAAVDASTTPPKSSKRAGKAVWVRAVMLPRQNRNEWDLRIDERMPLVPENLRADAPGEARSVVLLYPRSAQVGSYVAKDSPAGMTWAAYARSVDVWIVDMQKKKVTGHTLFASQPQQEIQLGVDSVVAELDDAAIAKWYAELPE